MNRYGRIETGIGSSKTEASSRGQWVRNQGLSVLLFGWPKPTYRTHYKRVFDFVLAALSLPLVAPVIALLWCLTRLDGGPGFFGHTRLREDCSTFTCWKIRTMAVGANEQLTKHLAAKPELAEQWSQSQKLASDPRVTRLGLFLRRTGLDELPQIWNILRGDMSFVGPRPITRDELKRYRGHQWAYFSTKPGLTGVWQLFGRGKPCYFQRVELDKSYVSSISFRRDCMLILQTFGTVLKQTGS